MDYLPVRPLIKYNSGDGAWMIAQKADQRKKFKAIICTLKSIDEQNHCQIKKNSTIDPLLKINEKFCKETIFDQCKTVDPNKVAVLNISFKNLESSEEEFYEFSSIYKIDASNNNLNLVNFLTFTSLVELNLSSNNLQNINMNSQDFENLQILDVSFNNLNGEDILMIGLMKQLKNLNLSGNNLRRLPSDLDQQFIDGDGKSIARFNNLEELNLEHNHLNSNNSFCALGGLRKLKILKLAHNEFESIPLLKCVKMELKQNSNFLMPEELCVEDEDSSAIYQLPFYKMANMEIRIPSTLHEIEEQSTTRTNNDELNPVDTTFNSENEDAIKSSERDLGPSAPLEESHQEFTSIEKNEGNEIEDVELVVNDELPIIYSNPEDENDNLQLDREVETIAIENIDHNETPMMGEFKEINNDEELLSDNRDEGCNSEEVRHSVKTVLDSGANQEDTICDNEGNHEMKVVDLAEENAEILEELSNDEKVDPKNNIIISRYGEAEEQIEEENFASLGTNSVYISEVNQINGIERKLEDENKDLEMENGSENFYNNYEDKVKDFPLIRNDEADDIATSTNETSLKENLELTECQNNVQLEDVEVAYQEKELGDSFIDSSEMENVPVIIVKQFPKIEKSMKNCDEEKVELNEAKESCFTIANELESNLMGSKTIELTEQFYDEMEWNNTFKMKDNVTYSMIIVNDLMKQANLCDIIRHISLNSFTESLPKPFPVLEFLDLSFNKIKSEETLIPIIAWLNMKRFSIFNNPVSTTKSQKSSFIKSLLENTFKITVEWLPPITKIKPYPVIPKSNIKVADTMSSLPAKLRKGNQIPSGLVSDQENRIDLPKMIPLPGIIHESKVAEITNEMENKMTVSTCDEVKPFETLRDEFEEPDLKLFNKNRALILRTLQHKLDHPITYFERHVDLFYKTKSLPPQKVKAELPKLKKATKSEKITTVLREQNLRSHEFEISLERVLSSEYFHGNRKKQKQSEIATKALKNMQKKYNHVRLESLKSESEQRI